MAHGRMTNADRMRLWANLMYYAWSEATSECADAVTRTLLDKIAQRYDAYELAAAMLRIVFAVFPFDGRRQTLLWMSIRNWMLSNELARRWPPFRLPCLPCPFVIC
jgi:hypothetical protein